MKFRSVVALLCIFAILFSFAACRNIKSETDDYVTVTDANGNTYTVTVSQEPTTNEKGETAPTESTTLSKEAQKFIDSITDPAKQDEYFEKNDAKLEISADPIDTEEMEVVEVKTDSEGDPIHNTQEEFFKDITTAEKYTIKMTLQSKTAQGENTIVNVTTMKNGDDMYVQTKLPTGEGVTLPISILVKNGKCTIYMDSLRAYMNVPQDTYASITDEMQVGINKESTAEYIQSGEIDVNGNIYTVDIYQDGDTEIKYFYLDGQIKRVETNDTEGNTSIIEYNEISTTVDESKFVAPKGYLDMTTLIDSDAFGDIF